jgi:CDGSH-type Zn-finger protein
MPTKSRKIRILADGPYLVSGDVPLSEQAAEPGPNGYSYVTDTERRYPPLDNSTLCRCGHSRKKPYCDGEHLASGFDGTETASREPFDTEAIYYDGPGLTMTDNQKLCSLARFCHRKDGDAWSLTENSDIAEYRNEAIRAACDCPSGRLVALDARTGAAFEPELEPALVLLQDPEMNCSGPIFVKGGIQIEAADGTSYERRNRVALCRCGESNNKPFCDATHLQIGFSDREA